MMNGQRLGLTTYYRTISVDNKPTTVIIGPNGEPLKLPESLESLPKSDHFPNQRHRWNTNEEIASMLIAFDRHTDWLSKEVKIRPKSGSMLLYSRKKVRYRRDGYCWKKRKDGKTTREDHMKLKVQGMECIYGCYVHSAILPTFHRRCYWLLQNPDIVLVHYLNVPYPDDNKMVIASSISLWGDKKEWTKDELISQLKPMFFSEEEPDLNNELEISTAETVEAIVVQLMEKQRAARTAALNKQLECGCPDSLAGADRSCPHHGPSPNVPRRVRATKSEAHTTSGNRHRVKRMLPYMHENNNQFYKSNDRYFPHGSSCPQVSSTTGNHLGLITPERDSAETPTPQTHPMGHHHGPPLVLSLSQIQQGSSLLIVNPTSGGSDGGGHSPVGNTLNGLTPLVLSSTSSDPNGHMLHSSARSDTMESSASSNSPVDLNMQGGASTSSPVSSAVRSLASLSDFSLDMNNGNYDTFGSGVQTVTDSMLSGHDHIKHDTAKQNGDAVHHGHHNHMHQRGVATGPLLDFRSAFSDFDGKTPDLGFFDPDEMHRHMKHHADLHGQHGIQGHHPHPHSHQHHQHASIDLNPMDFIEHDVSAHPMVPPFDLDPFDMLGEFTELDQYGASTDAHGHPVASSASSTSSLMTNITSSMAMIHQNLPGPMLTSDSSPGKTGSEHHHNHSHQRSAQLISDYSPEWSWADDETKVLVTGPWESGRNYQVLVDGQPVTTTFVQEGVLRCICPAHEAGIVSMQVSCDSEVVSDTVIFEYKNKEEKPDEDDDGSFIWECGNLCNSYLCETDTCKRALRTSLLEKIESIEALTLEKENCRIASVDRKIYSRDRLEDYLIHICELMSQRNSSPVDSCEFSNGSCMPTLLHLVAALNLVSLAKVLIRWVDTNPNPLIKTEVNFTAQDEEGFTPLMRACLYGFNDMAILLCRQNPHAIKIKNHYGETCLELAARSSEPSLTAILESFDEVRNCSLGARKKLASPGKGGEFVKPTNPMISSIKFRAKSVDNTDHLLTSSSNNCGLRFKMKYLSNSPSRLSSVSIPTESPGCSSHGAKRRLNKRPSLDSCLHLAKADSYQFINPNLVNNDCEIRKTTRNESQLKISDPKMGKSLTKVVNCQDAGDSPGSPFIDVEGLSDEDAEPISRTNQIGANQGGLERDQKSTEDQKVLSLAEQFIAAMPARIKNESDSEAMLLDDSSPLPFDASQSDDLGIESMADDFDIECDFSIDDSRSYRDTFTPSSASPGSSYLPSPISFNVESPSPGGSRSFSTCESASPPCTAADLHEFLQASLKCERELSKLTLSDQEQRELYEAAQIIQKAYRSYKGRKKADDQQGREARAAVLIQNYYRRYKEYLYWKQMAKAATIIQNQYRSYCEHKRFKKSQEAAMCIQNYYRTYKEHKVNSRSSRESTPSTGLKRTYSQRRQHLAAKKIQQFMRKSHLKPINEFVNPCRKGASERAGPIGGSQSQSPGCFTCTAVTSHTSTNTSTSSRKREAASSGSSIPAKLSGYSDANGSGNTLMHQSTGGNPSQAHLHHHHHGHPHSHHQHQQTQNYTNGYHPHPHPHAHPHPHQQHPHHHVQHVQHLRHNNAGFYGWHSPNHPGNANSPGPQHSLHPQLSQPPQVMAIANK